MQNIDTVLGFFATRIEKELGPHPTETSTVMAVITKSVGSFSRAHTLKVSGLYFRLDTTHIFTDGASGLPRFDGER